MKVVDQNKKPFLIFILLLAALAFAFSLLICVGLEKIGPSMAIPRGGEALFALAALLLLYGSFEKWGWKQRVFQRLGISPHPNLGGRWVGFLTSSYKQDGQNVVVPISLEVTQDASSVFIRAGIGRAYSDSMIADFKILNGRLYLYYVYNNSYRKKYHGHLGQDKGVVMLEYDEEMKRLKGKYFNDVKPKPNAGEVEVFYSGPKLYFK
jgi:hypothetical protein